MIEQKINKKINKLCKGKSKQISFELLFKLTLVQFIKGTLLLYDDCFLDDQQFIKQLSIEVLSKVQFSASQ